MERVLAYINGFNLYFGNCDKRWITYKWLDVKLLVQNLLKQNQSLEEVKYFTSRIRNNPNKERRQLIYLEALEAHTNVRIFYGKYQNNLITCRRCGNIHNSPNEKMTDVNIAVEMLMDAYDDRFDAAFLISGDSDLIPPTTAINTRFPNKRVFVRFPPNRHNITVNSNARGNFIIGRKKLKDSKLPTEIRKPDGYVLRKHSEWT